MTARSLPPMTTGADGAGVLHDVVADLVAADVVKDRLGVCARAVQR